MKRFLSLALVLLTVLSLTVSVAALDPSQDPNAYYGKPQESNTGANPQTVYTLENERINLQKMQDMQRNRQNPNAGTRTIYAAGCSLNVQQTAYWCGVASALNVIGGNGYAASVGSRTAQHAWSEKCYYGGCTNTTPHYCGVTSYTGKQVQLDYEMGGVPFGGASWSQISSVVNDYTPGFFYGYRRVTSTSELANCLIQTIGNDDKACIIWVDASRLPRYQGSGGGHYINVHGYNSTTGEIYIADCNYDTTLGGWYSQGISDVHDAMHTNYDANLLW